MTFTIKKLPWKYCADLGIWHAKVLGCYYAIHPQKDGSIFELWCHFPETRKIHTGDFQDCKSAAWEDWQKIIRSALVPATDRKRPCGRPRKLPSCVCHVCGKTVAVSRSAGKPGLLSYHGRGREDEISCPGSRKPARNEIVYPETP